MTHAPRTPVRRPALVAALMATTLLAPLVSCTAPSAALRPSLSTAQMPAQLQGPLKITFTAPLIGTLTTRMTAEPAREGFVARTRAGIAWEFVGGLEGLLGRMVMPKLFPDGVILTWTSGIPDGTGKATGRIGAGKFKSAAVMTRMTTLDGPIEVLAPDGRTIAVMRVERDSEPGTVADYPRIAQRIESAVKDRLFDRSLASSLQVGKYLSQLRASARIAKDDVEFIFGSALAGRNVKFSLPLVLKQAEMSTGGEGFSRSDLVTIGVHYDSQTRIATIRVDAFLDAQDVDAAFERALSHDPAGLLIDLKNCPGVTLASLRVLSWVCDAPTDAGVFFGPRHRKEVLRSRTANLPELSLDSASAVVAIENALDSGGAARICVVPVESPYRGPVAVRISGRTTTSAEPLAQVLKRTGRARLFGESTAGRPYLSRPIDVGQGWVLWLATCDYRGPAGEKITAGVKPHAEFSSKSKAREAATAWLLEQSRSAVVPSTARGGEDEAAAATQG